MIVSNPLPTNAPVVLVILDGWGIGRNEPGNAVLAADTPVMDHLWATYPHATLRTSGEDVGLPAGQMGNSEVGHMNLGAGFIVYQWITRIDKAIADGEFAQNEALIVAIDGCIGRGTTLHVMGLVSDGGVHSHVRHLRALLLLAHARGLDRVAVHAFTDGRDTPPNRALELVANLDEFITTLGVGRIATVSGRYYAMDRDKRWERTNLAYDAMVMGFGKTAATPEQAVAQSFAEGVLDEFILPTVIPGPDGMPTTINPGDAVISFNFRSDRGRQIVHALSDPAFSGFERERVVAGAVSVVTLTRYEEGLPVTVAFPPKDIVNPVARLISEAGLQQFHCAETEKYAHVTFFFNGGQEAPFAGEARAMVPSPKVATYDMQPEMSAPGVAAEVLAAIAASRYSFILVNFANADMVGHTGVFAAAKRAVETVDGCLGQLVAATLAKGGTLLVTADHGNAEEMIDPVTGGPMTSHTTNPVPLVLVSGQPEIARGATLRQDGVLSAIAPTILDLLGVPAHPDMTQWSLLVK